jgi:hypothetical protein
VIFVIVIVLNISIHKIRVPIRVVHCVDARNLSLLGSFASLMGQKYFHRWK